MCVRTVVLFVTGLFIGAGVFCKCSFQGWGLGVCRELVF